MEEHVIICRGCGKQEDVSDWASPHMAHKHHQWVRSDAYGIYTGVYCDECYEHNYPYKKDRYDYEAYGERLDPEW